MLPLPKTPSKVDDGIERIKQSLSTKWGIRFPVRDATPSKRDKSRVEEKILGFIQFLYFKEGALGYAIEQFEKNAIQVVSQWQFKPHGEPDVLPSLANPKSALKQDFLRKQHVLSPQAVTELTESLKYFLNSVADRVKAGEKFSTSLRIEGIDLRPAMSNFTQQAETTSDDPIATHEISPTKPDISKHHSGPSQWLRSESEPGPAKRRDPAALHPSSDDYPDHEIVELLANSEVLGDSLLMPPHTRKTREPTEIDHDSSSEDTFETPPTSPPLRADSSVASSKTRKRSCPDPMQAPPSRNVSRKTSGDKSVQEVSNLISSTGLSHYTATDLSPQNSQSTTTVQTELDLSCGRTRPPSRQRKFRRMTTQNN